MTAHDDSYEIVERMKDAAFYPEQAGSVRMVETHISWVFLTDQFAYKLKKPVQFDFLDFSTPELRHRACGEELRLNRRLASNVYLAVLPITTSADGEPELNGQGPPVDWIVQMRRLPAERALDVLLLKRRLPSTGADDVARLLANFYASLPPKAISPDTYLNNLARHVRANGAALSNSPSAEPDDVRRIHSAQLRFLMLSAEEFGNRVHDGRIVDGHGDLRPEHIYLEKPPVVIDCVEFSDELREVDVADELSFLAMECERLGDASVGDLALRTYEHACGDRIPARLLAFYRAYRACVRAKVALFRTRQESTHDDRGSVDLIQQYLDLARKYVSQLGPPVLISVGGLMGTGKSTLAAELAKAFDVDLLSTDRIRRAIIGPSESPAEYGEGHYAPEHRNRVYEELFQQAGDHLQRGQSLVLDGTFLKRQLRDRAYQQAERHGAAALHVHCACDPEIARNRIERRAAGGETESEARTDLYDLQARDLESPSADEPAIAVDTTRSLHQQVEAVCAELHGVICG